MASATGIPDTNPARAPPPPTATATAAGEEEPLLGRAGDASQKDGKPMAFNLVLGTAILAQAGIWLLTAVVWAAIFSNKLILFSAHPLLNSAGILVIVESVLLLQPTHTAAQKTQGTTLHAILNSLAFLSLLAGLVIIEYNKISYGGTHFQSPHAVLGFITYGLAVLQLLGGISQYYLPSLFGGVGSAKALYKYHRASGYLILVLFLTTVAAATQTTFNKSTLHIRLWTVALAALLTLAGVLSRVKKQKLGFR